MKATSTTEVDGINIKNALLAFANLTASKDNRTEIE